MISVCPSLKCVKMAYATLTFSVAGTTIKKEFTMPSGVKGAHQYE